MSVPEELRRAAAGRRTRWPEPGPRPSRPDRGAVAPAPRASGSTRSTARSTSRASTPSTPGPGCSPFLRGPYPTMYTTQPWTIRQYAGLLHRRGVQRVLPPQPGGRPEGPVGRLRPGHPPRLRLRPPAGARRRRHGRRGDRLDLRHPHALRRHPAGQDERVDDDERRRAAGAGALHRGGRGAGGEARAARGDHPERHPQGVHGPQHLHLPAGAVHADHLRHLRATPPRRCRGSTRSRSPATTCRRPGRRPTWSWPTPWPTAWSTSAPGSAAGLDIDALRAAAELLLGDRHELLHGGRQDARRPGAVGPAGARVRPDRTPSRCRCARTARPPAGR